MAYFDKLDLDPTLIGGGASPEKPKPAGFLRSVADLGIEAASGVARGVKATADAFGADNAVSRGADTVDKFAREYLSAAAKADDQRVSEIMAAAQDAGVWEQVKAAAEAFTVKPAGMVLNAFGTSVPTIAAAMIPGVGQAGVAARLGALGAMGAAQGAGAVKGSIYEAVKAEQIKAGASEAEAEAAAVRAQEYGGVNTPSIVGGAALGGAASATGVQPVIAKLLQRGAEPVAQAQRGILQRALNPEGLVARTGMGALKEAPLEAAQGGQEQYASNIALQNEGFDTPAFRGVAGAAALEGLASAGPGAAFAALDKPKVADVLGAPTVDEAIKKAEQVLALPAPASGVADELVDGVIALPGPSRPAAPPVLRALPAPDGGTVYMVDEAGNVALQPAAARAEAVTRAAEADIADTQQRLAERQRQTELGVTPGLRKAQEDREDSNLPVGEASDAELIPTGEAMELEPIPTGEASEVDVETIQPTDLMARDGQPFGSKTGAQAKAYASGGGKVVAIPNHFGSGIPGYVVRPLMPGRPNNTRGTNADDVALPDGQRPADAGRGQRAGVLPDSGPGDVLPSPEGAAGQGVAGPGAAGGGTARPDALTDAERQRLLKKWPGITDKSDEALQAQERWDAAQSRLRALSGYRGSPDTDIQQQVLAEFGGDAALMRDKTGETKRRFNAEWTRRMEAEADRLQAEQDTPGTLPNARRNREDGKRREETAQAMQKATQQDIDANVARLRELERQGRITPADALRLLELAQSSTDAFDAAMKLEGFVAGKSMPADTLPVGRQADAANAGPDFAPGSRVTLNGTPYTVTSANNTAVKLQGADGSTKMVARGSKTFQAIQQEPNEAARPQTQAAAGESAAPAAAPAPAAPAVVPGARAGAVEADGVKAPESALRQALRSVGIDPDTPRDKAKDKARRLRKQADELMNQARKMLEGIPPGQPVRSTRDANLRERAREKTRKSADLQREADALEAYPQPTSGEAAPAPAPEAERTPKAQAVKEALAATHKDPGEPAEPVTPAVVRESIAKAARNEDRPRSEMKADLLKQIDTAMATANDNPDDERALSLARYPARKPAKDEVRTYMVQNRLNSLAAAEEKMIAERERSARNNAAAVAERIGYVTFDVPGDGKFKVVNTKDRLAEFRKKVESSPGFKDAPKPPAPDRDGSEKGSGSKVAAFDNMVNEGDLEAASDYADAVGLELDPKKIANATKVLKWRETRPAPAPEAAPQPEAEAPAPAAEPDALPNPWEISQDEFVRRVTFTKEGSTAFPWVAKWGDRILEAENEVFDHPDLGKTVVQGGRFSKTKREAETVARGAHKRAVRRGVLNGNTATPEALAAYPDLQPAKPATPAAQAPAGRDEQPEAQAPAKPAPKSFRKSVKVKTAVFMEETSTFAEQEIDADAAIKALEADIAELQAFRNCIAGG